MRKICLFTIIAVLAFTGAAFCSDNVAYQHVRNATAKISYAGSVFLVDPFLAEKDAYPGFEGSPNSEKRIPLIDMAEPVEAVIKDVDAIILTHTHLDHWDQAAQKLLPKDIPFFVQNAGDARTIREQGFTNVMVVGKNTPFEKFQPFPEAALIESTPLSILISFVGLLGISFIGSTGFTVKYGVVSVSVYSSAIVCGKKLVFLISPFPGFERISIL